MSDPTSETTAEEIARLRAEVARLRDLVNDRPPAQPRRIMEPDPEMPGLSALWRGERGLTWRLFVQGAVSVNAVLAVLAAVTIASS